MIFIYREQRKNADVTEKHQRGSVAMVNPAYAWYYCHKFNVTVTVFMHLLKYRGFRCTAVTQHKFVFIAKVAILFGNIIAGGEGAGVTSNNYDGGVPPWF